MAAYEAVHRTILVFDIEQSNHPMRTNCDRLVIHEAMYAVVRTALRRLKYYHEDRGDGVLVLVPAEVPKGRLVSNLLARLEAALATHNAAMERQNAEEVVYHHPDAHPELFRRIETEVKGTPLSACIRVPGEILLDEQLAGAEPHGRKAGPPPAALGRTTAQLSGFRELGAT